MSAGVGAGRSVDLSGRASEVAIRLCREEDLSRLEWFGAFEHHREIIREAFRLQNQGQTVMLVAAMDDFPVGQAWLDLRPRPGAHGPKVWAVRVIASLQGRGIGGRLMARIEEVARQLGYPRLELGVEKHNEAARKFYERLGWFVNGERRDSYGYTTPSGERVVLPLDEWVLVKNLDQNGAARPTRA